MDDNTPAMSTSGVDSSISLYDRFNRLRVLRAQLLAIKLEIRRLAGATLDEPIPEVECLRCGWRWSPYNPFMPPLTCSRCGTTAWNKPPTENSRKPSDPPSPKWRTRKGVRRRYFRVKLEGETWKRKTKIDAPVVVPDKAVAPGIVRPMPTYVPPRISAVLPPPPSPSPLLGTLSERFAILRGERSEPQPETVASHPAPEEIITELVIDVVQTVESEGAAPRAAESERASSKSSSQGDAMGIPPTPKVMQPGLASASQPTAPTSMGDPVLDAIMAHQEPGPAFEDVMPSRDDVNVTNIGPPEQDAADDAFNESVADGQDDGHDEELP